MASAFSPVIDPIARYQSWFEQARAAGIGDPKAACLSTLGRDGRPSGRFVLVQYADSRGFVFFTNLASRKARELDAHPFAALTWHWPLLEQQIRAEGRVVPVSADEADKYFATRPRESQIGAWASRQSEPLPERAMLEARVSEMERRFAGGEVPRPPFWSGYVLTPDRVEFWSGAPGRLHHRELFELDAARSEWRASVLYP